MIILFLNLILFLFPLNLNIRQLFSILNHIVENIQDCKKHLSLKSYIKLILTIQIKIGVIDIDNVR